MTIPDRNLAFPGLLYDEHGDAVGHCYGMTLRDYFAAAALQGMANWWPVSAPDEGRERAMWHKATFAYEMADVMLAYRSKGSPT